MDNPQKVLLMGEAQDFGTCKAAKKNGEPCSQIVNMVRPSTSSPPPHSLRFEVQRHIWALVFLFGAVWVPVLPVPREGPVQEDELQEGRAAVLVFGQSSQ